MVEQAARRHPRLEFHHVAAERLELPGREFDYIILSDLVGYLFDIRAALERLRAVSHPGTRIVIIGIAGSGSRSCTRWRPRAQVPAAAAQLDHGRRRREPAAACRLRDGALARASCCR
jgi:ubiquinone/menaquinone biosynthesis C-methylase UbiE